MTNHFAATPTTTLLTGQGRAPAGLARVVEDVDDRCSVVNHLEPSGRRKSSPGYHVGRHGLQPRAELAGFGPWEAAVTAVAQVIEKALGTKNGRRVRWSWPSSSTWPRAKGGRP